MFITDKIYGESIMVIKTNLIIRKKNGGGGGGMEGLMTVVIRKTVTHAEDNILFINNIFTVYLVIYSKANNSPECNSIVRRYIIRSQLCGWRDNPGMSFIYDL